MADVPTSCLARGGHRSGRAASTERDRWPALTWASPVPCGEEKGFSDPGAQGEGGAGVFRAKGTGRGPGWGAERHGCALPHHPPSLEMSPCGGRADGQKRDVAVTGGRRPHPNAAAGARGAAKHGTACAGSLSASGAPAGTRPRCSLRPGHQQKSSFPGSERARGPHRSWAMAGRGTWSRRAAE